MSSLEAPEGLGAPSAEPLVHPLLRETFLELDRHHVRWCLLRGLEKLATPRGDVDLLVDPRHLERVETILRSQNAIRLPSIGRGTHRKWLVRDPRTCEILALDLVTELAFGTYSELRLGDAGQVIDDRVDGLVPTPAPGDRFWLELLHSLLDGKKLDDARRRRLRVLGETSDPLTRPLAAAAERFLEPDWSAKRLVTALGLDSTSPSDAAWRRPLASRALRTRRRMARKATRASVRGRLGMTVALMGPDGAGKSTLVDAPPDWPLTSESAYGGLFRVGPNGEAPGSALASSLRFRRPYARLRAAARRGSLVLLDRHPYDVLVLDGRTRWKRVGLRLLVALLYPPPDVIVVLDATGTLLHHRSAEHDADVLERQRDRYLTLGERLPVGRRCPTVVLDTTGGPSATRRGLQAALWAQLQARLDRHPRWWGRHA
jgi:hypothetical protein